MYSGLSVIRQPKLGSGSFMKRHAAQGSRLKVKKDKIIGLMPCTVSLAPITYTFHLFLRPYITNFQPPAISSAVFTFYPSRVTIYGELDTFYPVF
jgi:hypothetical protein